jgi:hypothetical protein
MVDFIFERLSSIEALQLPFWPLEGTTRNEVYHQVLAPNTIVGENILVHLLPVIIQARSRSMRPSGHHIC